MVKPRDTEYNQLPFQKEDRDYGEKQNRDIKKKMSHKQSHKFLVWKVLSSIQHGLCEIFIHPCTIGCCHAQQSLWRHAKTAQA